MSIKKNSCIITLSDKPTFQKNLKVIKEFEKKLYYISKILKIKYLVKNLNLKIQTTLNNQWLLHHF